MQEKVGLGAVDLEWRISRHWWRGGGEAEGYKVWAAHREV